MNIATYMGMIWLSQSYDITEALCQFVSVISPLQHLYISYDWSYPNGEITKADEHAIGLSNIFYDFREIESLIMT